MVDCHCVHDCRALCAHNSTNMFYGWIYVRWYMCSYKETTSGKLLSQSSEAIFRLFLRPIAVRFSPYTLFASRWKCLSFFFSFFPFVVGCWCSFRFYIFTGFFRLLFPSFVFKNWFIFMSVEFFVWPSCRAAESPVAANVRVNCVNGVRVSLLIFAKRSCECVLVIHIFHRIRNTYILR